MSLLLLLACSRETAVIEGNIPPSAVLLVPVDQGGLRQAPTLTFAALVADDRDPASELVITWTWEGGETIEGDMALDGDIASLALSSPGLGEHEVWIEVADDDGGTGGATARFTLSLPEDADLDGDGFIDAALGGMDCDDGDPEVNPSVQELCDGVDQDCDGQVDEGLRSAWYVDVDGDGYGDPAWELLACLRPNSHAVDNGQDCDDGDAAVFPGAAEVCDGVDQDCDGVIDEGQGWYRDDDGDGWGDEQQPLSSCEVSVGGSLDPSDCDDADPAQRDCLSCSDLWDRGEVVEGVNTLWTPEGDSFETLCDEEWTLIGTNPRSGAWNPANIMDSSVFGVPSRTLDFKSRAWSTTPFRDLRFTNDSEVAQYDGVGDGQLSWGTFQAGVPVANCGVGTAYEWPMTEGNLNGATLCSTNLYVNVSDWQYGATCSKALPAFGPTWSATYYSGCPFNNPHATGFLSDDLDANPFGADEGPLLMWVR